MCVAASARPAEARRMRVRICLSERSTQAQCRACVYRARPVGQRAAWRLRVRLVASGEPLRLVRAWVRVLGQRVPGQQLASRRKYSGSAAFVERAGCTEEAAIRAEGLLR
eukprot:3256151-Pleurochrysis_carterae.AAC.2